MRKELYKNRFYFLGGVLLLSLFFLLWMALHRDMVWITTLDDHGFQVLRSFYTDFTTTLFARVTIFGDYRLVIGTTMLIAVLLFLFKKRIEAIWFAGTMAMFGTAVPYVLKDVIVRPRPELGVAIRDGYSFPSGHVAGAAVLYPLFVVLAFLLLKKTWHKVLAFCTVTTLLLIIMWSRVHLGVHFLTDVLAALTLSLGQLLISTGLLLSYRSFRVGQNDTKLEVESTAETEQKKEIIIK